MSTVPPDENGNGFREIRWRLNNLEELDKDKEQRLRRLEGKFDVIEAKVEMVIDSTDDIKKSLHEMGKDVKNQGRDRWKIFLGFVVVIISILGSHFLK